MGEMMNWKKRIEKLRPFRVNDRVMFKGNPRRIPKYYTNTRANIPIELITHGGIYTHQDVTNKKCLPKITAIYKEFYIVKYKDSGSKYTALGFKKESLVRVIKNG